MAKSLCNLRILSRSHDAARKTMYDTTPAAAIAPIMPITPRLHWRDEFACGDALIDAQHKALFAQVNQMTAALDAGDSAAVLQRLDELVTHTIEHFSCEEEALRQCGYAGLREHQLDHLALLERTLTYRHDVAVGRTPLAELLRFLIDEVITGHLVESDRLYFDSLAGRTPRS